VPATEQVRVSENHYELVSQAAGAKRNENEIENCKKCFTNRTLSAQSVKGKIVQTS